MATLVTWDEFTADQPPRGGTIREIVLSEVANLVSKRRPLLSQLRRGSVNTTYLEKLEDTLASRAHNATLEGAAFTAPALTQPTRISQHVQSMSKWGQVSDEQRLTSHYNQDPFSYQVAKKLTELMNDVN